MISHRANLDAPRACATALAKLLGRHRRALGTRRRTMALPQRIGAIIAEALVLNRRGKPH